MIRGFALAILWGCTLTTAVVAQSDVPKGWHLLDLQQDSFYGISLNKAYQFLQSKNKNGQPVIVAVLDSGVDTTHEDLKKVLWRNPKEIPGNGIDDDKNGYVDDIFGWNFLGGKDGKSLKKAADERSRVYHRWKDRFAGKFVDTNFLTANDKQAFKTWIKAAAEMNFSQEEQMDVLFIEVTTKALKRHDKILRQEMGKEEYTCENLEKFEPITKVARDAKLGFLTVIKMLGIDPEEKNTSTLTELEEYIAGKKATFESKEKAPHNFRAEIVKDDYFNFADKYYGNNDVMGPGPTHGTHVTGIIGAQRNNGIGVDGVADQVKIMTLRVVPDGDEYDKDVALAIRYAVDNGAKIINMSFGKSFSPEKNWVDSAVRYAEQKDVLLIHASGNESEDLDVKENYPNRWLEQWKTQANNYITVGASSDIKISNSIAADFSSYGKNTVDVFAPGVKIYSTLPGGNQYGNLKGTSMATPIVTGLAAMLRSYYPSLTAVEVKRIIEQSAFIPDPTVECMKPGPDHKPFAFSSLCKTGGIINAYNAVVMAGEIKTAVTPVKPEKATTIDKTKKNKIMPQPQSGEYGSFFGRYVNHITAKNLQEAVTTFSHPLTYFFVNLNEEKADYSYAPGKWTLKDMLQHLIDTERIMQYRMLRIARKDATPLAGFEENDYAMHAEAAKRTFISLKEEFIALRKSTDLLIQSLSEEMLANFGTASGHAITANALGYIIFGHIAYHKTIVEERYL